MTLDFLSWKTRSRIKTNLITDLIKLVTHLTRKEMRILMVSFKLRHDLRFGNYQSKLGASTIGERY